MSDSVNEDILYIGKIILITWIVLSLAIVYNGKILEGLVLFSFSIHILLGWLLKKRYKIPVDLFNRFTIGIKKTEKGISMGFIIIVLLLLSGLWFIFRAISIVQHSYINYGTLRPVYNNDIIFAGLIGILLIITLIVFYFYIHSTKKN